MPEEITTEIEQMKNLFEKLAGDEKFARLRGKLRMSPSKLAQMGENPSDFCKQFDEWTASVRVMGNLLHKLKRDGQNRALNELQKALAGDHVMAYETLPVNETKPYTMIMSDTVQIIAVISWLTRVSQESPFSLRNYMRGDEASDQIIELLFLVLPTLDIRIAEYEHIPYTGSDLIAAMQDSVPDFSDVLDEDVLKLSLKHGQWGKRADYMSCFNGFTMAYLVPGDQRTVLKRFSRQQQKNLGSWQFSVPLIKEERFRQYPKISMHLESEHARIGAMYPALVSKSCQYNLGARLGDTGDDPQYHLPSQTTGTSDGMLRFQLGLNRYEYRLK